MKILPVYFFPKTFILSLIFFIKLEIREMFDWLVCYVLQISYKKLDSSLKSGIDLFTARNQNQVYHSKTLATVFIEVNQAFLFCIFLLTFYILEKIF
jgi:hypothetical protein